MKNALKTSVLMCALTFSSTAVVAEQNFKTAKYVGDTSYASFCKAVVMDDIRMLRASVSRQVGRIAGNERGVLRRLTEADGLKCNGESLVDFSKRRNANEVYAYLTATAR